MFLEITIPISPEGWDEKKQEFVEPKTKTIRLMHSLVSISKWEYRWHKPFLSSDLGPVEVLDYIKCMTITPNVDDSVYEYLTTENIDQIRDYINDKATATTFSGNGGGKRNREIVTSELIYYWMIALQIPPEYEKWHLNRLLTLIRVCNVKNTPPKKRNKQDTMNYYAELNRARRKQLNSKG